ncbi:hypothetical protein SAMN02949497_4645 [Methylomagnum ishizawai]|uniref:Uncharacterized protein n=1 Tax=Methylomagnum ishizawai TaxID=1760988 RepID=A0A1Y6DCC9_9GAMM|nr:hypothetical protein [Methylomagnum ishizawai]SMF97225.1 hypothetical protein SAMN02949497_4645 [Methylomagnum ishizawai]
MTQVIEQEFVIPSDGKLPDSFRQCFGRKARVVVLFSEEEKIAEPIAAKRYQVLDVQELVMPDRDSCLRVENPLL